MTSIDTSLSAAAIAGTTTTTGTGTAARPSEREQLGEVARQFEAIFVRQMLSAARKADFGEEIFGGQAMDTFRQMQDERFADIASQTGTFGMAQMLEAQLARYLPGEA